MRQSNPIKNVPRPAVELEAIFSLVQMFVSIISMIVNILSSAFSLFEDAFLLATAKSHPLSKSKTIRVEQLHNEPVLLLDDGHCLRHQVLSLCERAGAGEVDDFRASSLNTLVQMVSSGLGVTLLPEMAIAVEAPASRKIAIRRFKKPEPRRTICLAWRTTSSRGEEFRLLAQQIKHSMKKR